jgi:hypothetical protein
MPGEPITLGPFTGGVTTRVSDPSALQETDLVKAENFIYDIYGSLVTRPPIGIAGSQPNNPNNEEIKVVLSGFFSTAPEPEVIPFIIVAMRGSTQARVGDGAWTQIAAGRYDVAVQGSKGNEQVVWFAGGHSAATDDVSGPSDMTGGWWNPDQSSIQTVSGIPGCNSMVWYKERVFFFNTGNDEQASRVQFSDITPVDSSDFPSSGELFININDGQSIQDAVVFLDNIFVFKYNSTYIVTYDTSIDRVQIKPVSDVVGAKKRHVIQIYADTMFVFDNRFVWRFTGSQFTPLSQKIIVGDSSGSDVEPTLSQWADCLLLRYGTTIYVYNFYTDAWTTWKTNRTFNWLVKYAENTDYTEFTYYGGVRDGDKLVELRTVWPRVENPTVVLNNSNTESFTARIETKHYHFDQPFSFKRLFWWGANALITETPSIPLVPMHVFRGGFLPIDEHTDQAKVWEDLEFPDVVTTGAFAQFFKFLKGFRFRLAAFYLEFVCDGTSPNALNNITAVVKDAQTLVGSNKSGKLGTTPLATSGVGGARHGL